jgi:cytochrome c553
LKYRAAGKVVVATTEQKCLAALREAASELGESPTKAEYDRLGLSPSSTTIQRVCGSWNGAKERAGLETVTQAEAGGRPVQPKPDWVELPAEADWEALTPQQRWYHKHRDHRIECKERRRKRLQRWLGEYKRENCRCERCDETRPVCLDFHHPGAKTASVAAMANDGYSKERIRAEIDDCTVLCANCHRREHYGAGSDKGTSEDGASHRPRRRWVKAYKRRSDGCVECGEESPVCLDFHHTGTKTMGIGEMVSRRLPLSLIEAETDRCVLLCANCHRARHDGNSSAK